MSNQSQPKKINAWLYVILSVVPFIGYYPFLKLKKTRRIMIINIPIGICSILSIFFLNPMIAHIFSWGILPTTDAIFLYHWIKIHNNNLTNSLTP